MAQVNELIARWIPHPNAVAQRITMIRNVGASQSMIADDEPIPPTASEFSSKDKNREVYAGEVCKVDVTTVDAVGAETTVSQQILVEDTPPQARNLSLTYRDYNA